MSTSVSFLNKAPKKKFPTETLNSPGQSTPLDVFTIPFSKITCQINITEISGNVVCRLEGSNSENNDWVNLDPNEEDLILTTNGNYMFSISSICIYKVRFNFVSGTAQITVNFSASI